METKSIQPLDPRSKTVTYIEPSFPSLYDISNVEYESIDSGIFMIQKAMNMIQALSLLSGIVLFKLEKLGFNVKDVDDAVAKCLARKSAGYQSRLRRAGRIFFALKEAGIPSNQLPLNGT